MRRQVFVGLLGILGLLPQAFGQHCSMMEHGQSKEDKACGAQQARDEAVKSQGVLSSAAGRLAYEAIAGRLVLTKEDLQGDAAEEAPRKPAGGKPDEPLASMFYVYYKSGQNRPVTFLFNGGPGSASMWLHMGAFGPKRVVVNEGVHNPAAPYVMQDNASSLLDVSDLVFIDAPGTGFSRVQDPARAAEIFYNVDGDAAAFAAFIARFLTRYDLWNVPKYLFGESYGTMRAALLAHVLQEEYSIDLNGIMLLSQILSYANVAEFAKLLPSMDQGLVQALPTYAATAWYHRQLEPMPADFDAFIRDVQHFAASDYAQALWAGTSLPAADRQRLAGRLHTYTGLPAEYFIKASLRVTPGQFRQQLLAKDGRIAGRLDTRYAGPALDPLAEEAEYDPMDQAIGAAYVAAFNDYARKTLHFGEQERFRPTSPLWRTWGFKHKPPEAPHALPGADVLPDLAMAMKRNPALKVQVHGGYFDLATPFAEALYEMDHLPIPGNLRANITFHWYRSGHMVYLHEPALQELHRHTAAFIQQTIGGKASGS